MIPLGKSLGKTMSRITFDHCVIHVSSWERSTAFYRDVLGAEIVPSGKGFMFRFGTVQLNTHGPDQIGTPRAQLPVMPGGSDLCFEWHGTIEDAAAHLQLHGVAIEVGPVDRIGARGKGKSLYFRDPDGSLMEFIVYHS
jgi:catechol 2,3-dioxygenase-like lactoylglutathione lyase family enzyme